MCLSVCYTDEERIVIASFAEAGAQLPIRTKAGASLYLPWGRRLGENGVLPLGGVIQSEALKRGAWNYYLPKAIKLPLVKFLEADIENRTHWFDVTAGQWIQGAILQEGNEQRVYIVTIIPTLKNNPYPQWPRILTVE
jgi:hypothetical protein